MHHGTQSTRGVGPSVRALIGAAVMLHGYAVNSSEATKVTKPRGPVMVAARHVQGAPPAVAVQGAALVVGAAAIDFPVAFANCSFATIEVSPTTEPSCSHRVSTTVARHHGRRSPVTCVHCLTMSAVDPAV